MPAVTTSKADGALQDWLRALPAVAAKLDHDPASRRAVVDDAVTAGDSLLEMADARGAHPLLLARTRLARAALDLIEGEYVGAATHADAAAGIALRAAASAVRLEVLPRAAAMLAGALPHLPSARRRLARVRLIEVAEAVGDAIVEQAEQARQGEALLVAAQSLVDAAAVLRSRPTKTVVLGRALAMASDARAALARAGELAQVRVADDTVAAIVKALS